jgi:hypothetical protein
LVLLLVEKDKVQQVQQLVAMLDKMIKVHPQ